MSASVSTSGHAGPPGGTAVLEHGAVQSARPQHSHLGLALVVIATAQLMVVLDATIVNVALPKIQTALGFSGSGLEWVVNAYALAFGGLLLLGGRLGDLLGRRRVFVVGILVFSIASLVGGFATGQAWLLIARAVQGAGAAVVAPTALSLVTVTFPEGPPRNRAMGVYAAMSMAGGAVGLIAGGLLTTYASWRWVLFVNVPIGIAVALLASRVLGETNRHRGRLDMPGAITGSAGLAALVYGLSSAAAGQNGISHWGDPKVVASLVFSLVSLIAFVLIESRSKDALLPLRLLRNRNRSGAYLIMLCVGTAIFGIFFFLTIYMQGVWGYSALKTGIAYLPMVAMIMAMAGVSAQLVSRIGARPLLIAGSAVTAGGLLWLSRITEHSQYAGGLLGPLLVTAAGVGMLFMPLTLVALTKVDDQDAGVASGVLNATQQIGGSIGLALLGTVAWTVVAHTAAKSAAAAKVAGHAAAVAAAKAGHPLHLTAAQAKAVELAQRSAIAKHALAVGFSRGFEVSAAIAVLALVITLATIRIKRDELSGADAAMVA